MADQPFRIGFIGAGGIVRTRHVPGLKNVPGVELYGVVNSSPESSERAAQEFGITRTFPSWKEMLDDKSIDAIWIGTQPYLHRELSIAGLDAGKHVFCQARMAMDAADAQRMLDRAKRSDRTTMLCPPPHYMEGDRLVRRMVHDGFLGSLRTMYVRSYNNTFADPAKPLHWREIGRISGVNTMDIGMMSEVTTRWVGPVKRVIAHAYTTFHTRPTEDGGVGKVDRPDTVSAIGELERGGVSTFVFSTVVHHASPNTIELYGSDGSIKYVMGADHIMAGKAGDAQLTRIDIKPEEWRNWTVEQDFVTAARNGNRTPEPSFDDGVKYMRFTEAVFKSAASGRAVDV
jgi:predicted dehydrogenase